MSTTISLKGIIESYNKDIAAQRREVEREGLTDNVKAQLTYLNQILATQEFAFVFKPFGPEATIKPRDTTDNVPIRNANGLVAYLRHEHTNYQAIIDQVSRHFAPATKQVYSLQRKGMVTVYLTDSDKIHGHFACHAVEYKLHKLAGKCIVDHLSATKQAMVLQ